MKRILLLALVLGLVSCGGHKGESVLDVLKGETGAKGDKGDTGAKGDKGDPGAKGDKGDTGAKGDDAFNAAALGVSIINSDEDMLLIRRYLSTSKDEFGDDGVSTQPANKNTFIFKNTSDGKLYYIDLSSYSGALIRMDVMTYISQNAVEVTKSTSEFATGGPGNIEMSNYWYSDASGNYYFSENGAAKKDLEALGASIESAKIEDIKDNLYNYGFSSERAEKLSRLLSSYRKIQNKRGLNERERNYFTNEVLGISFKEASEALVGDGLDSLIEKASEKNETDPEAIKELIEEIM